LKTALSTEEKEKIVRIFKHLWRGEKKQYAQYWQKLPV